MTTTPTTPAPTPVQVSPEAVRALATHLRAWSGWADARLEFGNPMPHSPYAACDMFTRTFVINPDTLVLNPNRVLLTVTPFRLRQEAVLTGAMLHEVGHARFTRWGGAQVHSDGTPAKAATIKLAMLMEEPRVEGLMAAASADIGATGLDWTMRAAAAHLMPMTKLHLGNPDQMVMDVIESWTKRAGRLIAFNMRTGLGLRNWVNDYSSLLHTTMVNHLTTATGDADKAAASAIEVHKILRAMIGCDDHAGTTMIDLARDVLSTLFPETADEDMPEPSGGCSGSGEPDPEGDDEGQDDEPEDQPEDTPEDDASDDESDEQDSGEGEAQPEDDDASDDDTSEGESEGEASPGEAEGESEGEAGTGEGEAAEPTAAEAALAAALAELNRSADDDITETQEEAVTTAPPSAAGGTVAGGAGGGSFRYPTADERGVAKAAERFLRDLIDSSETVTRSLSESPSSSIDGAAYAAWKAGGQTRDPMFFKRLRRTSAPTPPVKIAILVDVSVSMDELQAPSALLAWSLASAALDLRNFAGRGQQVESCMINWGSSADVIVGVGDRVPGIRTYPAGDYSTSALGRAMGLIEEQMPGFFDITEHPVNRLIVNFTDWEINGCMRETKAVLDKAFASGVNMLSVVPHGWRAHGKHVEYRDMMAVRGARRSVESLVRYDPSNPGGVWEHAAKALL